MANGKTYGVTFPFNDSFDGKYLDTTDYEDQEIRSSLIHLLLTRKGARYFLPDFGTRLYEYIFEPLDGPTFNQVDAATDDEVSNSGNAEVNTFSIPGRTYLEYTAKVKITYTITSNVFNSSDFIIINL